MSWRDLIQKDETLVAPWIGGRSLRNGTRTWTIDGEMPPSHGWWLFKLNGRKAIVQDKADPNHDILKNITFGYLVGDRFVLDNSTANMSMNEIIRHSERVWLIEPGLDRFVRISVGRTYENGFLVFKNQEMPIGLENDVFQAFLDGKQFIDNIKGITPALDVAFRMEVHHKIETERRRLDAIRKRQEEEERRNREEKRQQLITKLGDGISRREMAKIDFAEAAKSALAIGGAVYLDSKQAYGRNEMVVRFRLNDRRFECTCDSNTLQIIDSGICLTAEYDDGPFEYGTKGDSFLTLESLPSVILEADRIGKLVIFRHV